MTGIIRHPFTFGAISKSSYSLKFTDEKNWAILFCSELHGAVVCTNGYYSG